MNLLKGKKVFTALVLMFAIIINLSGCNYATDGSFLNESIQTLPADFENSEDTWAFYWYLCGSDLESDGGFATADLEEMLEVKLPDNVSVVIETGGANVWSSNISSEHNSRYLFNSDGFFLLEENFISNMGKPETLEDFLVFCNENYPADRQAVIFWNHGAGSVGGVAYDELFDFDSLTLPEMREAFESVGTASGLKYELIGFDTCLMATIDVVDVFGDYGNYLVASEEWEPGGGWDYKALFSAVAEDPTIDGAELGKEICDSYYKACEENDSADMATLSVVNLALSEKLVSAYNDIGTDALAGAGLYPTYQNEFGRAARSAENYGGNNDSEGYTNMVDLGDLVRKAGDELLPYSKDKMLSVLDEAVIYKVNGPLRKNASGLSCYYNYDGDYDNYTEFMDLETSQAFNYYYDYMLTGEVSDGLVAYMETASTDYEGEEIIPVPVLMPEKTELEDFPVEITDDGIAVLNLGTEIANKLVSVYMTLAYVDDEGEIAILLGFDNDLEADWEKGIFQDNFRGVWGSLDGELVYMELSDESDDYQVYAIPVLVNGEEYTMLVSYIFSTEEYKILGLRSGIDDNGMADKNIRPLIPGDVIEPIHYVIDIETGDAKEVPIGEITVKSDTSFYEVDLGDGEFIFMFEMSDIQNNSYLSETVRITVENGDIYLSEY